MLPKFAAATILVGLLFASEGLSQSCYTEPNCVGSTVEASTARECCVETENGTSFGEAGNCAVTQCIVHGFDSTMYVVEEGQRLDTTLVLNVKGTTVVYQQIGFNFAGTILSEAAGSAISTDFEVLDSQILSGGKVQFFTTNDEITLEYDDRVLLTYTPDIENLAMQLEQQTPPEFLRSTAIVQIEDDDPLQINFGEADYSFTEGSTTVLAIPLQFRETQNPFNLIISPLSIDQAEQLFQVRDFIDVGDEPGSVATSGDDFTNASFTVQVPASEASGTFVIPKNFGIIDDDINEIEQSFALVAELGEDVPDRFVCFQTKEGSRDCLGRRGATEIRIVDNDAMVIGFSTRRVTVSEGQVEGVDLFALTIDITSLRTSEQELRVLFRVQESSSTANVEAIVQQFSTNFDAQFGTRSSPGDPIVDERLLEAGKLTLQTELNTFIRNDFRAEDEECYTIRVVSPDQGPGVRQIFDCYEDIDVNATNFFCQHTICIEDDDDPFRVAFVRTLHTVDESVGSVEVCVNLTHPNVDILDEFILLRVIDHPDSIYIPNNTVPATPDIPNFLRMYSMAEGTDYEQQIRGLNQIRNTVINATQRLVCYDQVIHNDLSLEGSEYAGLTLEVRDGSTVQTTVEPGYENAAILIVDDDSAVVGLERTIYRVLESVGIVRVCAAVLSPNITCPIQFPFSLTLSTLESMGGSVLPPGSGSGSGAALDTSGTASSFDIARSPDDFIALTLESLEFESCQRWSCVNITVVDDEALEMEERFTVVLNRTADLDSRITLDPTVAEIVIIDDDDAVVGFERMFYNVTEDVGMVEVCTVVHRPQLACPISFPFILSFDTRDGSALQPADYERLSIVLMFDSCDNRSCAQVNVVNDEFLEGIESFFASLGRSPGLDTRIELEPINTEIQITDDDVAVVGLERTYYNVSEAVGVVEVCAVVYQPTGDCPIEFPFNATLTTRDGSAVFDMDYGRLVEVILEFEACELRRCLNVFINNDLIPEDMESFLVILGETPGLSGRITLEPTEAEIAIIDANIAVVGLEMTEYIVSEDIGVVEICAVVYEPDGNIQCPIDFSFEIQLSTTDDSAVSPDDYGGVPLALLLFAACQRRSCLNVTIVDDDLLEGTETFRASLTRPFDLDTRIILDPVDGVVQISDNDEAVVGLEMTVYSATEGIDSVVEVCAVVYQPNGTVCPINFSFDVQLSTFDDSAESPDDYISLMTVLAFPACEMRVCEEVAVVDDSSLEMTEFFNANLTRTINLDPRITLNPVYATVNIFDNDVAVVGLEKTVYVVSETVGMVEVCVVVHQPNTEPCPISFPFEVVLSTINGTATEPMDFTGLTDVLMFPACATSECRMIAIVEDDTTENVEMFNVSLSQSSSGLDPRISLEPVDAVVEIIDANMAVVGLERRVYSVLEDVFRVAVCVVVLSPNNTCPINFPFDVRLATNDDTAVAPDDYGTVDVVLSFGACERRRCTNVSIVDDAQLEETESLSVTLTRINQLDDRITLNPMDANIIITDNDEGVVGLEETVFSVTEDTSSVELCVIVYQPNAGLSCPIDFEFDVTLSTEDDTAVSSMDYMGLSTVLMFSACERRQCLNVTITEDLVLEETEYFNATLTRTGSLDTRITLDPVNAVINIIDNDMVVVGLRETVYSVMEGVGVVEVCAVLHQPPLSEVVCPIPFPFNISLSTRNGTAKAPMDYETLNVLLMFEACVREVCSSVVIVDDVVDEPNESFFVNLARTSDLDTRINLSPTEAEIIIEDNDIPIAVGYEFTSYTTTETGGYVELCVVISEPSSGLAPRAFELTVNTAGGSAVATVDYEPLVDLVLRFEVGEGRVCHNISIIQDNICEDTPENFTSSLSLGAVGVQPITITNTPATVVIEDSLEPECNPIEVGYERTEFTVTESEGSVELCAVIFEPPSGMAPRPFQLSVSTANGTAVAPMDYREVLGLIIDFQTGQTRACHRITVNQDTVCEEPPEEFLSHLTYQSGVLPITVVRTPASIIINDSTELECNEITVGYEFTVYMTSEGEGAVELCALITEPDSGGAPRVFSLVSSTRNSTARAGVDYMAVSVALVFAVGDERVCHQVVIIDDTDCEPTPESLFADLSLLTGDLVTVEPDVTEIIIDDSDGDDCDIVVGFEQTLYTTEEDNVSLEICVVVYQPSSGGAPRPFTLTFNTTDYTAESPEDYIAVIGNLTFQFGDGMQCYFVQIVDDEFCDPGLFFTNIALVSGEPVITVEPDTAQVSMQDPDCEGLVNDTLTGDPLMTVPFYDPTTSAANQTSSPQPTPSLCYEVHGQKHTYFNLISDTCTSVNAFYEEASINSSNIDLNVVTRIGVRAVARDNETCVDIQVDLHSCNASVDGVGLDLTTFAFNGISVRRKPNSRVRIAVPNCANTQLVMYVFCASGMVEDPVTWEYYSASFIRFVVLRGLNLNEFSHGLLGQFWNVPVRVQEFTGLFDNDTRPDDYVITVRYPGAPLRSFVGIKSDVTWELERRPCYFVGNGQGGKLSKEEIASPDPNDSVIEGYYTDYIVESTFATDYKYSHFDERKCETIA